MLPDQLINRVQEGQEGNVAADRVIQRGRVTAVRVWLYDHGDTANPRKLVDNTSTPPIRPTIEGPTTLESYLADVEVVEQGGRVSIIENCLSTIPVQVGHQVLVNQIHGDIQRGGIITGLAVPPKGQILDMESRDHSGDDNGVGLSISKFGGNENPWIVNNVGGIPGGLQGLSDILNAARGYLEQITGIRIYAFDNVLTTSGAVLEPSNRIPANGRLEPESEQSIIATSDEMRFECEQLFGEIAAVGQALFRQYGRMFAARLPVIGTRIGFQGEVESPHNDGTLLFHTRSWIVLRNPDTGEEYIGTSALNDFQLALTSTWTTNLTAIITTGLFSGRNPRLIYSNMVSRAAGHSWVTTFRGLSREIGNELVVDLYYQMAVYDRLMALSIPSSSLRFRGRWQFQMRELGFGSGV